MDFETSYFPWLSAMMLSVECNAVITLRMIKLVAGGPEAFLEAQHMISEKVTAAVEAAGSLLSGGTPAQVVARYRETVAANTQRLA